MIEGMKGKELEEINQFLYQMVQQLSLIYFVVDKWLVYLGLSRRLVFHKIQIQEFFEFQCWHMIE